MPSPTPAAVLMLAAAELHKTAAAAERALASGNYPLYSSTVTEAVARFGALHRAYRIFLDSRTRYTP